jgi:hypothetical protein
MPTTTRIDLVRTDGNPAALVRARSQSEAIRHCTANRYDAVVADQDTLVKAVSDGIAVEDATTPAEQE